MASVCVIQMYGICFIMLGIVCLFGHIIGVKFLTALGSDTDMSPATGIGFITLGTSYFVIARLIHGKKSKAPFGGRNQ